MIYNHAMENIAILLIGLTLLLLTIVVGLLSFLVYKLLFQNLPKNGNSPEEATSASVKMSDDYHPEILDRIKNIKKLKTRQIDLFCPNHSELPGEVSCAICDKIFCRICIKPFKTMHFCNEHLPLVMKNDWIDILTIKTSTTNPEKGVKLFEIKKEIFEREHIPSYIETHYKINIDHDYIETYLVLYSIQESAEEFKGKLSQYPDFFET